MSDVIAIKRLKAHVQENGIIRIENVPNGERNLIGRICDDIAYKDIPEYKENLSDAVKLLTKELTGDLDFRIGYQANIAMAFVDACKDGIDFENVPYDTLHQAANDAANRFLTNWCHDSNKWQSTTDNSSKH